ncbi:MAG: InlB B-repeat-containing protein [Sphaerochaeta sp.]|nr:InlB B-repeat-containing protein [Sphaerochaeta sp.]
MSFSRFQLVTYTSCKLCNNTRKGDNYKKFSCAVALVLALSLLSLVFVSCEDAVDPPVTSVVTFDKQSGTGGNDSVTATVGAAMPTALAPTRTGYEFGGYYAAVSGGGTQYYDATMGSVTNWDKTADTPIYANWIGKTYAVTLDRQLGTGGSGSATATYGSAMPTATAPTKYGNTFGGYYSEVLGGGTQYYNASMGSVTNWDQDLDSTLYAKWSPYVVGDTGPTGGKIFHIKPIYDASDWNYLEMSPTIAIRAEIWGADVDRVTNTAVGTGEANTTAIAIDDTSAAYWCSNFFPYKEFG